MQVCVLRALPGLGDMLCAVPALHHVREALPNAQIVLIARPSARGFVQRNPKLIDELVELPGFPGLAEPLPAAGEVSAFLTAMQARRFDLAIQMHGSGGVSNVLTALLGANAMAGCYLPGNWRPEGSFIPYPSELAEPLRWTALVERMGLPAVGHPYVTAGSGFSIMEAERSAIATLLPNGRYAIVHPGASELARRWPAARFAAVADALAKRGYKVVLSGTGEEAPLTAAVAAAMTAPAIDLAGRTSLGTIAALIEGADLLVTNDTGVSHLAAAIGTPSVVLFLASDRRRWAPVDGRRHRAVGVGLADAATSRTPPPPPTVGEVLAAIDALEPSLAA